MRCLASLVTGLKLTAAEAVIYRAAGSLRQGAKGFILPHLIVEYSGNIESDIALDELLDKLHALSPRDRRVSARWLARARSPRRSLSDR